MRRIVMAIAATLAGLAGVASLSAAPPLSVRDSFRIGSAGTSFCSAQSLTTDKALTGMFDAGYSITCRDAVLPVGKLYKIRSAADAQARLAADRASHADCQPARRGSVVGVGAVDVFDCKLKAAAVDSGAYEVKRGSLIYASQGLAGYDSALVLGLKSLLVDQPVKGE